jgi:hypothetical protein
LQKYFGPEKFTIWQLFKEEKQKIINQITAKNLKNVEASFRKIYEDNYQLMSGLKASGVKIPEAYTDAVEYILNIDLKNLFMREKLEINDLKRILDELSKWDVDITDESAFRLAASERIYAEIKQMEKANPPLSKLQILIEILDILFRMDTKPDVWKSQNVYFNLVKQFDNQDRAYPSMEWKNMFIKLGYILNVKTEQGVPV